MEKISKTILSLFAIGGASLFGGVFALSAKIDGQADAQTTPLPEFISPTSYEQYLDLTAPSDVAVNERYVAIADGNVIYLYDNENKIYREYLHGGEHKVTKMQFSDNGELYFCDESTFLYQLNMQTLESAQTGLVCSTFALSGNEIYFSNVSGNNSTLSTTTLANPQMTAPFLKGIGSDTVFSICDEEIFYTDSGNYLHKYPSVGNSFVSNFQNVLSSVVATPSLFYCTDVTGNFSVYNFNDLYEDGGNALPVFTADGDFSKLALFNGYVYAVDGASIRQYSIEDEKFTDYEICSSSDSVNRLHDSTDVLLHENKILTADKGNNRISVREPNGEYRVISTQAQIDGTQNGAQAQTLAATENTVLIAVERAAYLYDLTSGEFLQKFDFGENKLTGAVGVYGKYYFVTHSNGYYVAERKATDDEKEIWTLSAPVTKSGSSPTHLAADVYGDLYVVRGGNAYKYGETAFLDKDDSGKQLGAISTHTKKIAVDYGGNLYALADGDLTCYYADDWSSRQMQLPLTSVYSKTQSQITSFTFGVEEQATYVLYNGNYVLNAPLDLPTVKTILVQDLDEKVFSAESAQFSVVQTQEKSLLVEIDFETLNGSEHFPYLGLTRSENSRTTLKIGELSPYNLLAEYDENLRQYHVYLVKKDFCAEMDESEYFTTYEEEKYGYLTNEVHTYKFPYLTSLLTIDGLDKNAKIQLLGEVTKLDHDYYRVSYQTETGEKTGYIPKGYITDFDGSTPETEKHLLDDGEADVDMIWRLAYIICGFAAICILTDYLILRKKDKKE